MKSVFSAAGLKDLRRLRGARTLIALDFDGTLAPIVSHPDLASTPAESRKLMRRLNRLYEVAVISGRARRDLRPRLGFKPQFVIGNHGIEADGHEHHARRAAKVVTAWTDQLNFDEFDGDANTYIENKRFSLSLHYRGAPHGRRGHLKRHIARLNPEPRVLEGPYIFNLTPQGVPHKGDAIRLLMRKLQPEYVLFMGDEETDEDVFRLKDRRVVGIRVGRSMRSQARYYVTDQAQVHKVLKELDL